MPLRAFARLMCVALLATNASLSAALQPEPAPAASSAIPTSEQAQAAWEASKSLAVPEGAYLRVVRRLYPTLTHDQLAQREQAIAQFPDHPDRRVLDAERRRLERGHEEHVCVLWSEGHLDWRWSQTIPGPEVLQSDMTVTPSAQWWMTAQALSILQADAAPPPGKNFARSEDEILQHLRMLAHGNLGLGSLAQAAPEEFHPDGAGLRIFVSAPTGLRTQYLLTTPGGLSAPVVTEFVRFEGPDPSSPVHERWVFSDWRDQPALGYPLAMRAERMGTDGRVNERWDVTEVRDLREGEFDQVTAIPDADSVDPIRGPVTFRSIFDYRDDAQSVTSLSETGPITSPMSAADLGERPRSSLRLIGWVTAGALAAALLAVRIARAVRRDAVVSKKPA